MADLQRWNKFIHPVDIRRDIIVPGNRETTLDFCVEAFIQAAEEAIEERGAFYVALSGGSTPKAVFAKLAEEPFRKSIDWSKVHLFWSDERCVPPDNNESNYHMAMEAGFASLPVVPEQIHRMPAEVDVEAGAVNYEQEIAKLLPDLSFDLILLGMGDDGHTASLFPETHGLHPNEERLVIANYVPQKETWRMSFTFHLINLAKQIHIYVLGANKADIAYHVLKGSYEPDHYPIQRVGEEHHKALWILDNDAAAHLD